MEKKLRISFVIPPDVRSGGVFVVLEYYRRLTNLGHKVNIFYPLFPYWELLPPNAWWKKILSWIRHFQLNLRKFTRAISLFSEKIPVKPVIRINDIFIPNADAVVATVWPTAYDVVKLSDKKGRKFYFVQHYEIWCGGPVERVDGSYRLPLNIITIAPWLTDLMKSKFNRNDVTEIHNGIRFDKFYPPASGKIFAPPSILLMAHDLEWKGTKDAIDALTIVKKRCPQLEIKMFGMYASPAAPFDFEYHRDPPYEKLLSLYQDAAIFISPSHKEGWHLPPMEAMACKCAVIATNVGCIPVINNGENLILVEAKKPSSIADAIIILLNDTKLAEKIAYQGFKSVQEMDWEKSAHMLQNCFLSNLPA
jgi:glycosyltransferase involved in cell wall biosynthesis